MCKRAMSPVIVALVIAAAAGGFQPLEVGAQTYESQESLVARIQTLGPLVEEARVEAEAAEAERLNRARRAAEAVVALDTFDVGQMTIISPAPDTERARDLFESAWDTHFAGIESDALGATLFTFQARDEPLPIFVEADALQHHLTLQWWQGKNDAQAVVANAIANSINQDLTQSAIATWAIADPLADYDPAELYRRLATTPSRSVRECLAGTTSACSTSLGLVDGTSIEQWYSAEERRALALTGGDATSISGEARVMPEVVSECLDDADADACDAVLLSDPRRDLTPLTAVIRASVIHHALEMGGDGAWARLVEARNYPIDQALAHTAGADVDVVVASWNAWILAARPEVHASLGSRSFFALMWTLLFAVVAMRSTRWRLG